MVNKMLVQPPLSPPSAINDDQSFRDAPEQPSVKLSHCHKVSNIAVQAMLEMLRSTAKEGMVSLANIEKIAAIIADGQGPLTQFYELSQSACHASWTLANIEKQRTDHLGRLLVEPFVHCLDKPHGIERTRLAQFFEAIHLMLGEEVWESLKARATLLAQEYRDEEGMVDWPNFHASPEAYDILEQVLVAVARSFRRFEPRKDWMLVVLNSTPNSISMGTNVFVPKGNDEKVQFAFTQMHLSTLLLAMFDPVKLETFDEPRELAFEKKWGVKPQKVFGPFFVELLGLSQRLG